MVCAILLCGLLGAAADESDILRNALALAQQGRLPEAEVAFNAILQVHSNNDAIAAWALPNLAGVFYAQRRWAEAETTYRRAYEVYKQQSLSLGASKQPEDWTKAFETVRTNLEAAVRMQNKFLNQKLWGRTKLTPKGIFYVRIRSPCVSPACIQCELGRWADAAAYEWNGVVVESDPNAFEDLVRQYGADTGVMAVNAAISGNDGAATFFTTTKVPGTENSTTTTMERHVEHVQGMRLATLWDIVGPLDR
jgi:tetratricopeptide (TPR) repeat protein